MSEDEKYILSLSPDKLALVPHDVLKWVCCVKGCNHFTRVKDFGVSPQYWWRKQGWHNLSTTVLYCGKHWKIKHLIPEQDLKLGSGIIHLIPNS